MRGPPRMGSGAPSSSTKTRSTSQLDLTGTVLCTDPPHGSKSVVPGFPGRSRRPRLVFALFVCFHKIPEMLCFVFTFVCDTP